MRRTTHRNALDEMMKRPIPKKKVGIIRLEMVRESRSLYGMERFHEAGIAADMVRPLVARSGREMFLVMSLDAKLTPLAMEIVSVGGVDVCCVDMRDIFRHSILNNASKLICFHNHPSGDPEPSREDITLTRSIRECGELLGIELVDHIIIGDEEKYFSFRNEGIWEDWKEGDVA